MTSATPASWPETAAAVYRAARPYERDRFDDAIGTADVDESLRADLAVAYLTAAAGRNAALPSPIIEWVNTHWDTRVIALQHQVGGSDMQIRMVLTAALWVRHHAGLDLDVHAVHDLAQRTALVLTGAGTYQAQDA